MSARQSRPEKAMSPHPEQTAPSGRRRKNWPKPLAAPIPRSGTTMGTILRLSLVMAERGVAEQHDMEFTPLRPSLIQAVTLDRVGPL
jgi:hypothetical protein